MDKYRPWANKIQGMGGWEEEGMGKNLLSKLSELMSERGETA